jgi:hypothetical protein
MMIRPNKTRNLIKAFVMAIHFSLFPAVVGSGVCQRRD